MVGSAQGHRLARPVQAAGVQGVHAEVVQEGAGSFHGRAQVGLQDNNVPNRDQFFNYADHLIASMIQVV